jgi:hypothetical protein
MLPMSFGRARSFRPALVWLLVPLGAGCGNLLGLGDFEDAPEGGATSSSTSDAASSTSGTGGQGGGASTTTSATSGTGGAGTGGDVNEGGGGAGGGTFCEPLEEKPCYEGPPGTEGKGTCVAGKKKCLSDGSAFGDCVGDVTPAASDDCVANEDTDCDGDVDCQCVPGTQIDCYDGAPGTEDHAPCHGGQRTCDAGGAGYGDCLGQVVPEAADVCGTATDENCDGVVDDLCTCMPATTQACYSGPNNTEGVGNCHAGTQTCNGTGTAWGACSGEVLPAAEDCKVKGDEACDGTPCSDALWSHIYTTAQKEDYPVVESIDTDGTGNVVLSGSLLSLPMDLGNGTTVTAAFVVKVDTAGNVLWSKQWPNFNVAHVRVAASAVDVYAMGEFYGSVDVDGTTLTSVGGADVFVACWGSNGVKKWAVRFGGPQDDVVGAFTHQNGVLLAGGGYSGTMTFSGGASLTAVSVQDAFVAKIDPLSGAHLWSKGFGDAPGQSGKTQLMTGLGVDAAGSAFVGGQFATSVAIGGSTYLAAGGDDLFVAKLSGVNGAVTWSKAYGGVAYDHVNGLAVDSAGAVILTGYMGGAVNFGGGQLPFGGAYDAYATKLDANGSHVWSKSFGGSGGDLGESIAVDGSDNVILSGTHSANGINFGGGLFTGADNYSTFIAKLDPSGGHIWSKGFDAVDLQFGSFVAIAPGTNRVAFTFTNQGTVDFGNGPLTAPGTNDSVVVGVFYP